MQPFINTLNKYKLHIMEGTVAVTMCQGVFSWKKKTQKTYLLVCKPAGCIIAVSHTPFQKPHFSSFSLFLLAEYFVSDHIPSIPVTPPPAEEILTPNSFCKVQLKV